jgi:hypothetical protein
MEFSHYITPMLAQLAGSSPALLLWIAVIVFAAIRLRRGGGRAEKLLLAGGIVRLVSSLLTVPLVIVSPWLLSNGYDMARSNDIHVGIGLVVKVVGAAGLICLIGAFWVKFKERNNGAAQPAP